MQGKSPQIGKIIGGLKQIYQLVNQVDNNLQAQIPLDSFTRPLFHFFLRFAYVLFLLGIILNFSDTSLDKQSVVIYIQQTVSKVLLIAEFVIGALIIILLFEVKQHPEITPYSRKILDFITDVLRQAFYIIALVIIGPYVFENSSDNMLLASFWIYLTITILFFLRKLLKWILFFGKYKDNLIPWTDQSILPNLSISIMLLTGFLKQNGLDQLANFKNDPKFARVFDELAKQLRQPQNAENINQQITLPVAINKNIVDEVNPPNSDTRLKN